MDLERIKRFCAEQSPAEFADQLRVVHTIRGNPGSRLECPNRHRNHREVNRRP
jgi:hypothetical protein